MRVRAPSLQDARNGGFPKGGFQHGQVSENPTKNDIWFKVWTRLSLSIRPPRPRRRQTPAGLGWRHALTVDSAGASLHPRLRPRAIRDCGTSIAVGRSRGPKRRELRGWHACARVQVSLMSRRACMSCACMSHRCSLRTRDPCLSYAWVVAPHSHPAIGTLGDLSVDCWPMPEVANE